MTQDLAVGLWVQIGEINIHEKVDEASYCRLASKSGNIDDDKPGRQRSLLGEGWVAGHGSCPVEWPSDRCAGELPAG